MACKRGDFSCGERMCAVCWDEASAYVVLAREQGRREGWEAGYREGIERAAVAVDDGTGLAEMVRALQQPPERG